MPREPDSGHRAVDRIASASASLAGFGRALTAIVVAVRDRVRTAMAHTYAMQALRLAPLIAVPAAAALILVVVLNSGQRELMRAVKTGGRVSALAWSDDGRLYVGTTAGQVLAYTQSGAPLKDGSPVLPPAGPPARSAAAVGSAQISVQADAPADPAATPGDAAEPVVGFVHGLPGAAITLDRRSLGPIPRFQTQYGEAIGAVAEYVEPWLVTLAGTPEFDLKSDNLDTVLIRNLQLGTQAEMYSENISKIGMMRSSFLRFGNPFTALIKGYADGTINMDAIPDASDKDPPSRSVVFAGNPYEERIYQKEIELGPQPRSDAVLEITAPKKQISRDGFWSAGADGSVAHVTITYENPVVLRDPNVGRPAAGGLQTSADGRVVLLREQTGGIWIGRLDDPPAYFDRMIIQDLLPAVGDVPAVAIRQALARWRPSVDPPVAYAAFKQERGIHDDRVAVAWLTGRLRTTAVALSPDGTFFVVAGNDGQVYVAGIGVGPDGHTPALGEVFTIRGHGDVIFSLAISPDGRTLASASLEGRLWLTILPQARRRATWLFGTLPTGPDPDEIPMNHATPADNPAVQLPDVSIQSPIAANPPVPASPATPPLAAESAKGSYPTPLPTAGETSPPPQAQFDRTPFDPAQLTPDSDALFRAEDRSKDQPRGNFTQAVAGFCEEINSPRRSPILQRV